MLQVTFEVKADQPCQIPVIGEFEAGETKQVTKDQEVMFKTVLGQRLSDGVWPNWVHLTAILSERED